MQAAYLNLHGKWLLGRLGGGDHDGVQLAKVPFGDRPANMRGAISERDGELV